MINRNKLTFGKHEGKTLFEVPLSYLTWLAFKNKSSKLLRAEAEKVLLLRLKAKEEKINVNDCDKNG